MNANQKSIATPVPAESALEEVMRGGLAERDQKIDAFEGMADRLFVELTKLRTYEQDDGYDREADAVLQDYKILKGGHTTARPIATAPKGPRILAWGPDWRVWWIVKWSARRNEGNGSWVDDHGSCVATLPTHWMPLPPRP